MRKSLWRATLGALFVLAAVPSMASAAFTPTITQSSVQPGCFPKGALAIPVGMGAPAGPANYKVAAVVGGTETAPCAQLPSAVFGGGNQATFLQWAATPGATSYRIFRGDAFLIELPAAAPGLCPAANAAARCQYVDQGPTTTSAGAPKPLPAALTQGGSHPDFNITQAFDYGGANTTSNADDPQPNGMANSASLKDNVLHFPAGLLASAVAANDTCSISELIGAPATATGGAGANDAAEDKCPRASQVGQVLAQIQTAPVGPTNPPTPTVGDIYLGEKLNGTDNVTARLFVALRPPCSAGYPAPLNPGGGACNARLGAAGREVEKSFLSAKATIRQDGTFGIDNETTSVATGADEDLAPVSNVRSSTTGALLTGVPIQVRSLTQTLFGNADQGTAAAADDKPFVTLPTSCAAKTLGADAASYLDPTLVASSTPLQATGCDTIPFSPELAARVDLQGQTGQNDNPGFVADIVQSSDEAATRKASVTLPQGLGTNLDALSRVCTVAQQNSATGCPASSAVGFANATTSVLPGTLQGPVFIAENNSPSNTSGLPKLIVALDGAAKITFDGAISFDSSNTRLVNTFDNLPEVTLSSFTLAIAGGEGGLLANSRDLCDQPLGNIDATFTGHNEKSVTLNPPVSSNSAYYCLPDPPPPPGCKPKKPKQSLKVTGVKKGRPKLNTTVRRRGNCAKGNLRRTTVKLAKGLKFAKGAKKRVQVRVNGKKVKSFKAKGRTLRINSKASTRNIKVKTKARAINESRKVRRGGTKKRLKFTTKVRVRSGKNYTIRKSVKPKS